MGQAKARGTFEQRASEAKLKRRQAEREENIRLQEYRVARAREEEELAEARRNAVRMPDGSRVAVIGAGRATGRINASLLAVAAGAALLGSMR